jgi:hypothetical protein
MSLNNRIKALWVKVNAEKAAEWKKNGTALIRLNCGCTLNFYMKAARNCRHDRLPCGCVRLTIMYCATPECDLKNVECDCLYATCSMSHKIDSTAIC